MSHEAQFRLPEWVSNPAIRIAAGAVALGGSLAGCGGDETGDMDPGFTPDATHTLTIEPTPTNTPIIEATPTFTPTATPTLEPTATPTPTPEAVADVPCKILPDEYCKTGELIDWEYQGQTYKMVGFNLPAGTTVYAPVNGELGKAPAGAPFQGNLGSLREDPRNPRLPNFVFIGDVAFNTMLTEIVTEGQVIATVGNNGITNFEGGYNLLLRINHLRPDGQGFESDIDTLNELFPGLVENGAVTKISQTTPVQPVVINSFQR